MTELRTKRVRLTTVDGASDPSQVGEEIVLGAISQTDQSGESSVVTKLIENGELKVTYTFVDLAKIKAAEHEKFVRLVAIGAWVLVFAAACGFTRLLLLQLIN